MTIKEEVRIKVERVMTQNKNIYFPTEFSHDFISSYRYHLTYEGRLIMSLLEDKGFTYMTLKQIRTDLNDKTFMKGQSGNRKAFFKDIKAIRKDKLNQIFS